MARTKSAETLKIETLPYYQIPPHTGKRPSWAIVREIDFEVRHNELWFYFSKGSKNIQVGNEAAFGKLIDRILDDGLDWLDVGTPEPPYASPLSLQNKRFSYIVYVLSSRNWQFGRHGLPITAGKNAQPTVPNPTPDQFFYTDAYRVGESFTDKDMGTPFEQEGAEPKDNCKIAYVIAKGDKAGAVYSHALNLHVDLIYEGKKRRFIPLMIDPDVRYPGGSNFGDEFRDKGRPRRKRK